LAGGKGERGESKGKNLNNPLVGTGLLRGGLRGRDVIVMEGLVHRTEGWSPTGFWGGSYRWNGKCVEHKGRKETCFKGKKSKKGGKNKKPTTEK